MGVSVVIGVPDAERGQIVKAYVVLRAGQTGDAAMVKTLQDHVKATVAPYKYPRAIEYVTVLPRTQTFCKAQAVGARPAIVVPGVGIVTGRPAASDAVRQAAVTGSTPIARVVPPVAAA